MPLLKLTTRLSTRIELFNSRQSSSVRVRFAPSPTGYLHLGGLRTALFNHLFAKGQGGTTILRIEDTDQERKVDSATEELIKDLAWCGIRYDEGPYFQSERFELYKRFVTQLLEQGDAYFCFCSNIRLDLLRREAMKAGEVPKYDNKCRHLSKKEITAKLSTEDRPCIRFKLTDFKEGFNDLVYGLINYNVADEEGDPVIMKKDGYPTYHFANVVDDHCMEVSHVLRGVEWQKSTPKHLLLYKAFKWKPPEFAHLPLLLNPDGTKLSKRQGGYHIRELKENGYLPTAVTNFIIRSGGGFDMEQKEKDIKTFSFEELIPKFELEKVRTNSSKIFLDQLNSYNCLEIQRLLKSEEGASCLVKMTQELVKNHFKNSKPNNLQLDDQYIRLVLKTLKLRLNKLQDLLTDEYSFIWYWDESNVKLVEESNLKALEKLIEEMKEITWNEEILKKFLKTFTKNNDLKVSIFMKALRLLLTGREFGPSVAEIMNLLGKDNVMFRLVGTIKAKANSAACQKA